MTQYINFFLKKIEHLVVIIKVLVSQKVNENVLADQKR